MSRSRWGPASAEIGGRLYAGGGGDEHRSCRTAERFDPQHNIWEALPLMDHMRAWAAAVSLGGRLYVAGGDGGYISLASAERFVSQRNLWLQKKRRPIRRSGLLARRDLHFGTSAFWCTFRLQE